MHHTPSVSRLGATWLVVCVSACSSPMEVLFPLDEAALHTYVPGLAGAEHVFYRAERTIDRPGRGRAVSQEDGWWDASGQWCRRVYDHLWCENTTTFWGWGLRSDKVYITAVAAPLTVTDRIDRPQFVEVPPLPAAWIDRFDVVRLVRDENGFTTLTLLPTDGRTAWWEQRENGEPVRHRKPLEQVELEVGPDGLPHAVTRLIATGERFRTVYEEVRVGPGLLDDADLAVPEEGKKPRLWEPPESLP